MDWPAPEARRIAAGAGPFCCGDRICLIRYFRWQQRVHRQGTINGLIRNSKMFCTSERRSLPLKHVSQFFRKSILTDYANRHISKVST